MTSRELLIETQNEFAHVDPLPLGELAPTSSGSNPGRECSGGTCFGDHVFFGGLKTTTSAHITFDPGRYIFAGAKPEGGQASA